MSTPARLAPFSAPEIAAAEAEAAAIFASVAEGPALADPDYTKAYTICMTPRSGSTFLARAMAATGALGHPQEYIHRLEPTALAAHARLYGAKTWRAYLAALGARTSTANGVFGVKADPNMLLPLLSGGVFDTTLRRGKFIYVTRDDMLMQAISLTKAQHSGAWTERGVDDSHIPFNFDAIYANVAHLAKMTASWEMLFAYHGIAPLRITYERIDADINGVLAEIGQYLDVALPPTAQPERKRHQRNAQSAAWRTQFLAALHPAPTTRGG
jgi:LPS sulfotransferase NodH